MSASQRQATLPSSSTALLESAVQHSLRRHCTSNAIFLAERLAAERPGCAASAHLLAECYVRAGKHQRALLVVEPYVDDDAECRHLFAVCCMELGEHRKAYAVLSELSTLYSHKVGSGSGGGGSSSSSSIAKARERLYEPWLAEGYYMLGQLYRRSNSTVARAVESFVCALQLNPTLWCCVEELAALGACPDLTALAGVDEDELLQRLHAHQDAWQRQRQRQGQAPRVVVSLTSTAAAAAAARSDAAHPAGAGMPPSCMSEQTVAQLADGWRHSPPRAAMELLARLGTAHALLLLYRPADALALLDTLPARAYATGWVLAQVGRAHFEAGDFAKCARTFEWSMEHDGTARTEALEYYSTALWHLRREVELSAVARYALEHDRFAASSWCAAGNAFSLQRDPDTAIKFFLRAAQVEPQCAYACTLAGHEYVYKDDFESALVCYQDALTRDRRHYNAWYGIGQVYQRQEKYRMAERHYRIALRIHERNSMLWYHLGYVLHAGGRMAEAMEALEHALRYHASNPVARFERSKLLLEMGRAAEAWDELSQLQRQVPREAPVSYQMGMVAKAMGERVSAARLFSAALDLDPKQSLYRQALASLAEEAAVTATVAGDNGGVRNGGEEAAAEERGGTHARARRM